MRPALLALVALVACTPSSHVSRSGAPSASIDPCADAVARARREPDLRVDQPPAPLAYRPAPIGNPIPDGVIGKNGKAEVEIQVVVDTAGRADMRTFKVVRASHPWLGTSVRDAVRKWRFAPARLDGCKVPRLFHFSARAGGR